MKKFEAVKKIFAVCACIAFSATLMFGCAAKNETPKAEESSASSSSAASESDVYIPESVSDKELPDGKVWMKVNITIDPSEAKGKVPPTTNTDVLGPLDADLQKGFSAYELLVAQDLPLEGTPEFVTSINGLANGELGPTSGWMFTVNGETPMTSADQYVLAEGDKVVWKYVTSWE